MIKNFVCVVDVVSRVPNQGLRERYRKVHRIECRLYELYVAPGTVKRHSKTHSKEIAKVPAWRLKEKLSEHLNVANGLKWAKDYAIKNSFNCFFKNPMPCKFARYDELLLALGFDDGTPFYVLRDRLLEEGLAITRVRGELGKARNPTSLPRRRNKRFLED